MGLVARHGSCGPLQQPHGFVALTGPTKGGALHVYFLNHSQAFDQAVTLIIPILEMGKPRLTEVDSLAINGRAGTQALKYLLFPQTQWEPSLQWEAMRPPWE